MNRLQNEIIETITNAMPYVISHVDRD